MRVREREKERKKERKKETLYRATINIDILPTKTRTDVLYCLFFILMNNIAKPLNHQHAISNIMFVFVTLNQKKNAIYIYISKTFLYILFQWQLRLEKNRHDRPFD